MNYYKYMSAKELGLCYSIIPFDQYNTICEPIPIRIASSYKLDKIDFRAHKENQRVVFSQRLHLIYTDMQDNKGCEPYSLSWL